MAKRSMCSTRSSEAYDFLELQVEVVQQLTNVSLQPADLDPPWRDVFDGSQDDFVIREIGLSQF